MLKSDTNLELPYITANLPGIGGSLRASPDHFVVEEVPLYDPAGDGQHLYVNLTKIGLTTKDVQRSLAKIFQVDQAAIGFAGMKDKHARTTQTFSLPIGHTDVASVERTVERIAAELPVAVHWAKQHGNKLKAGHLLGNRFRITVSSLSQPASELLPKAEAIAQQIRENGVANYFGPQRFGLGGANIERGLEVLLGKKRIQDRWLRRFLVSSYQSYLCNRYLSQRVAVGNFHHLLAGDIAKKHDTGGIFDVTDLAVEQPRYQNQEISFTAPMYGPKMRMASAEAGQLETDILDGSGITLNQLRRAKVDGTRRLGRLLVPDITVVVADSDEPILDDSVLNNASDTGTGQINPQQDDSGQAAFANQQLVIEFFLPKGAFATTVLREIMKLDLDAAPDIE